VTEQEAYSLVATTVRCNQSLDLIHLQYFDQGPKLAIGVAWATPASVLCSLTGAT
jgi:hypothetical protein